MSSAPPYPEPSGGSRHLTDRLGALAGAICAVHCAATVPLAGLLATTDVGLGVFFGHESEWVFVAIAAVFVLLSSVHGFRHHRSWAIPLAFAASFAVWIAGTWLASGALESVLHVTAALGLAITHIVSYRRLTSCQH